jgi:hypothetical protein
MACINHAKTNTILVIVQPRIHNRLGQESSIYLLTYQPTLLDFIPIYIQQLMFCFVILWLGQIQRDENHSNNLDTSFAPWGNGR